MPHPPSTTHRTQLQIFDSEDSVSFIEEAFLAGDISAEEIFTCEL